MVAGADKVQKIENIVTRSKSRSFSITPRLVSFGSCLRKLILEIRLFVAFYGPTLAVYHLYPRIIRASLVYRPKFGLERFLECIIV